MKIESFDPIVDNKSRILILGTMPGVTSLKLKEYYGHEDNLFWDIMFRVCDTDWPCDKMVDVAYDQKIKLALTNGIAIWDVLKHCDRKGSLDREIRGQLHNDFVNFFAQYSMIEKVFFNGHKAERYFEDFKNRPEIFHGRQFVTLSSTSPSNTTNSFWILGQWKSALRSST